MASARFSTSQKRYRPPLTQTPHHRPCVQPCPLPTSGTARTRRTTTPRITRHMFPAVGQRCTISSSNGLMGNKTLSMMDSELAWLLLTLLCNVGRAVLSSMFCAPITCLFYFSHHHPTSCQCGISRSATMVIALVMRAAAERHSSVPPEVWALKGMQGAYSFVKEKSPCVGPNMS